MKFKNLTIIGTSHIAKQSINEIKHAIESKKPDIVAVELDKKRYHALLSNSKRKPRLSNITRIGLKGYLFSLIAGYVQEKLGKYVGVAPGSDMLTAIKLAKKNKLKLALIDQDIQVTLKRLSKAFTLKEIWHFIVDLFNAVFFRKREMKKLGMKNFDLTKVPEKKLIKKLIGQMNKRYPNIYKVLIKERNHIMARNLIHLMNTAPDKKIIAVIGAGHEDDLLNLIKKEHSGEITYSFRVS